MDITGQVDYNSHTDAVLAVTVALVNALTPGCAHGRPYQPPSGAQRAEAARYALNADGVARPRPVSAAEADELAGVAAELRHVFEAVATGDVDRAAAGVNGLLARTGAHPYLDKHDDEPWHLHFHGTDEGLATGWAAGCAAGLAVVLGGTRRFCSTTCQNRVKAASFRERKAGSAGCDLGPDNRLPAR
jgi:Putative stress-induced transcription regulator/CGNR zinc finger